MLAGFPGGTSFIMSLAVLAFGSSMLLLVCPTGFYGWERYARIARGLADSRWRRRGAVRGQAKHLRAPGPHWRPASNAASTLIVFR